VNPPRHTYPIFTHLTVHFDGLEVDPDDVGARLRRPGLDLDADTRVGSDPDGTVVAFAEAACMGIGGGRLRIRLTAALRPDRSDALFGSAHAWLIDRARATHREHGTEVPAALGTRCASIDATRRARLEADGFTISRHLRDLIRPADPVPEVAGPDGIDIAAYRHGTDEAVRIAHNDAYADVPGSLRPDPQAWPGHAVGLPTFVPEASFLALEKAADRTEAAGAEIAGFLFSLVRTEISGVREGIVHCLGVRPPWRRHGVASAMIARALAAHQDAGLTRTRLQTDAANDDALSVYRRMGFVDSGRGYAMFEAPLERVGGLTRR
jgi:mycothiol synthase